jgi:hypothetical protein
MAVWWKHGKGSFVLTKVSLKQDKTKHFMTFRSQFFILDLQTSYSQLCLYIGFTNNYRVVKSALFIFGGKLGSF